jgi:hypothetical protein
MDLQLIHNRIFTIRGLRVMIDFHLAELYGVETRILNQAVKRNQERFPTDFMIQLTLEEWTSLLAQIAILEAEMMRSQIVISSRRANKYRPYAFTEQGVAMLSSILKSGHAIDINITIMRAFVILRQHITNYKELSQKIDALERKMDRKFKDVHEALNYLFEKDPPSPIGFKQRNK